MDHPKLFLKRMQLLIPVLIFISLLASCREQEERQPQDEDQMEQPATAEGTTVRVFEADLLPLNSEMNNGRTVSGDVELQTVGNELHIMVQVNGLEPNRMYLQHLRASEEGERIICPGDTADTNNDGVIDVNEATATAGQTTIPLHQNPSSLEMDRDTYPVTNAEGGFSYRETISLDSLRSNVRERYDLEELDFSNFIYLIHGVREGSVPGSAASIQELPAHQTLPVGCASLVERYNGS